LESDSVSASAAHYSNAEMLRVPKYVM
jgi:hypothetical protein